MGSLNKVQLIGFLGADPELKYVASGRAVCNLRIATSEKWKDKQSGQMKEQTEWTRVVIWGETGENVSKYLSKGSQVYVEGKLQTRTYDKDGQKHYATDVVAHSVVFLDRKGGSGGRGDGDESFNQDPGRPASRGTGGGGGRSRDTGRSSEEPPASDSSPSDDDIPFIHLE